MWNKHLDSSLCWHDVAAYLEAQAEEDALVRLNPFQVEHPRDGGLLMSVGLPVGQRADYRLDLGQGKQLAVQDFGNHYLARIEHTTSAVALERLLQDTPGSSVVGMVALGALVGLALGRSKEGALAGATIGGMAGVAGVAVANASSCPETSSVATELFSHLKRKST